MIPARRQGGWLILLSIMAALVLTAIPLPEWANIVRPEWVALVLIYWCVALPYRVGIGIAWSVGLFLDVMKGALLGQHALGLSVVAYVAIKLHRRIRNFPLWHQALIILPLIAIHLLLVTWVKGIVGQPPQTLLYWLPAFSSMLLWPAVYLVLRSLRRRYRVV